jgi:chemotaxis family two-component system sensor kinase Cph1
MSTAPGPSVQELHASALLECAREPIRTPGGIQPRGALLVVDEHDLRILYASDNLDEYLGRPARRALGALLHELSPDPIGETARALLGDNASGRPSRLRLADGRVVDVFAHRSGEHAIIELEDVVEGDAIGTFDAFRDDVLDTLGRFRHARDVAAVLEASVSIVHEITGFDRVLAYRFEEDGHGIVENERRTAGLDSLLGQHFPASDIPAQARALYREQWIRVIPDSALAAVEIIGLDGAAPPAALDLSAAILRAVSPIHLQYLRNMDVRASLSVSLVVDGKLWGLIVCHNYDGPRVVSHSMRAACEVVGMTASMSIGSRADLAIVERRLGLERVAALLLERVAGAPSIAEGLLETPDLLLGVCDATGVAVRVGGALRRAGAAPSEAEIERIHDAVRDELDTGTVVASDRLSIAHPELADVAHDASGVLAMNLSHDGANMVMWFRPELISTVTWAGEPEKAVEVGGDGMRSLGPRRSFSAWAEIVRGRSAAWGAPEIAAVSTLRSSLGSFLLERAEQLAFALESTRRYDREHYIAQTLKESLLPAPLPDTPGLDVQSLYLPAGEGYGVSGDFLEVFPVGDGWFAVIGDVCGKGPPAAALTVLARHSIRAVVLQDPAIAPSRVVSVLNEAFMDRAGGLFASVQIARMTPAPDGRVLVALCSAGHPPALHRHGSSVTPRSSRNVLVGARRGLPYGDVEIELAPGDALVLYTDGVTEAGRPNELFGDRRLNEAIASVRDGAASATIIDAIERAMRAHQIGEFRDDVAILCLQAPARTARARGRPAGD